jgi:hypothetical protein
VTFKRLETVPRDYVRRKELWIRSSVWLSTNEGPFVTLSIQDLGYAERLLLAMEERIATIANDLSARDERERLLMECRAHSILWIFGLYEVVRVAMRSNPSKSPHLKELFAKLGVLRMPLAKHEVKSLTKRELKEKGIERGEIRTHHPSGHWYPDTGQVGWRVFNPHLGKLQDFTRTELANEFLSITATEPIISPVPIGGPLGRPD